MFSFRVHVQTRVHMRDLTCKHIWVFIFMFEKVWTRISILNDKKKALEKGAFWLRGIPSEDKSRI